MRLPIVDRRLLVTSAAACVSGLAGSASAQALAATPQAGALAPAPAAASPAQAGSGGAAAAPQSVEAVVVTALRRETALQDTPLAISAIAGNDLRKLNATSAEDLVRYVPGLNITNIGAPGNNRVTIRGVQGSGESTAGFYVGDTPLTGPNGGGSDPSGMTPDLQLYDVGSIEVLRGPQGTLYGSGSMTGTFKVLYRQANPSTFTGELDAAGAAVRSGGAGYFVRGFVNLPVVQDRLGVRAVAYDETRPGYVDNIQRGTDNINRTRTYGGRLMVDFEATPSVTLTGMAIGQKQTVEDVSFWYPANGVYKLDSAVRNQFPNAFQLYNGALRWRLPFADFTATSSFWRWDSQRTIDSQRTLPFVLSTLTECSRFFSIATPCDDTQKAALRSYISSWSPLVNFQPLTVHAFINEARLGSRGEGPLLWALGGYLENRDDRGLSSLVKANPATGLVDDSSPIEGSRTIANKLQQKALYGEATYSPIEPLSLTLGARWYAYDKTTFSEVTRTSFINTFVAGPGFTIKASDRGWVTKINLSYKLTHDLMLYAQRSEGFRPGGVNNAPGLPPAYATYNPDSLVNYEVGMKSAWLQGAAVLNAAAYRIDWSDMQIFARIPSFGFTTNVGKARIDGLEIEGTAKISDGLSLQANLNFNHGVLLADQVAGFVQAPGRKGDHIPYEPSYTAALAADYAHPLDDGLDGSVRLDFTYTGPSHSEYRPTNPFYDTMGDFGQVNLRFGADGPDWGASLSVQNLLDTVGKLRVDSNILSTQRTLSIPPLTVTVEIHKTF